jgi:hypothetical protein
MLGRTGHLIKINHDIRRTLLQPVGGGGAFRRQFALLSLVKVWKRFVDWRLVPKCVKPGNNAEQNKAQLMRTESLQLFA